MDRLLPFLRVESSGQVFVLLALITLISVAAPVLSVATALAFMPGLPAESYWGILALSAAIPLLIAPPIAVGALSILRLLTITIDRLDNCLRYDSLTGVLSRVYLLSQIRELLTRGGSFLMIDADHFKSVNDTYGHEVGDEALKRLAEVLKTALPPDALVGRLGGEEFGAFLPKLASFEAASVGNGLCEAVRRSGKVIAGRNINLTISIGVAFHRRESTFEQTVKFADEALYHAKRSGRDRCHITAANDITTVAETNAVPYGQEHRSRRAARQLVHARP